MTDLRHPLLEAIGVPHGFGVRDGESPPKVLRPLQVHGTAVATVSVGMAVPEEADAIVSDPGTTPVIGNSGYTLCTYSGNDCDRADLAIENETLTAAIASNIVSARVERMGPAFRPPPRILESSIDKFSSASFEVTTTYDRVDESLGRQQITEGVLVLVPAF